MLIVRLFFIMVAVAAGHAAGQGYPNKPIRIITGATGGGIDFNARAVGDALTEAMGQQTVIDNRGGGGGIMAGEMFVKSQRDGYTLLVYSSNIWLLPLLRDGVNFDPVRDFAAITLVSRAPNVLVVPPSLPVNTVKEFIAMARAQPGKLNYAHAGIGGSVHLAAELFCSMAGVNIVPVAYKSNPPAYADVMSGQVQAMFVIMTTAGPLVQAGRMRALGVSSRERTPLAPGLPTIAESGLPGYENYAQNAVFAPAGTSSALIRRLNEVLVRWAQSAATREKYLKAGQEAFSGAPSELASLVKSDMEMWRKVIKERGIRAQ